MNTHNPLPPPPANPPSLDEILAAGRDPRGATRHDGWTPEKIYTFLLTLAETGCVSDAAAAAGMTARSAYRLRNRAQGRGFHYAWEGALQIAKRLIADGLISRAINGYVDTIRRNGVVVAERHRFDNRLGMAALTRLDQRLAADHDEAEALRIVVEDFEQFSRIIANGGAGAAAFIADRRGSEVTGKRAERLLKRLDDDPDLRVDRPGSAASDSSDAGLLGEGAPT